jgi:hypothetical protein
MKVVTCISNHHQVGYVNGLKASCNYFGLDLVTITTESWSSHRQKDILLMNYLESIDPSTIVLFTDGYDTMFLAREQEILEKYHKISIDNSVVISADRVYSPDGGQSHLYPRTPYGYHYLNTGGIIGKATKILEILKEVASLEKQDLSEQNQGFYWSNQYLWSQVYLSKKIELVLDHGCEIFQTACTYASNLALAEFNQNDSELGLGYDLQNNQSIKTALVELLREIEVESSLRIYNKSTQTQPCHIHFCSIIFKIIMFTDPFVRIVDRYNS